MDMWLIIEIIVWIIVGGIIGWLASKLVGVGRHPSILMDVVIGIAGAFLGGVVIKLSTGSWYSYGLNLTAFMLALAGAIGLIVIYRLIRFWLL
jgi:uncharacterized membrane protein YeaQ/YmgE (transglycosylase-associated protein family)